MSTDTELLTLAREYIAALEAGATGDDLARFFTADVVQEEFPSRLAASGTTRDLAEILAGAERGAQLMAAQRYEILHAIVSGPMAILEIRWTGTLAAPADGIPAGGEMRARLAVFLQFRDGKIARQRNYDCFEPWCA